MNIDTSKQTICIIENLDTYQDLDNGKHLKGDLYEFRTEENLPRKNCQLIRINAYCEGNKSVFITTELNIYIVKSYKSNESRHKVLAFLRKKFDSKPHF